MSAIATTVDPRAQREDVSRVWDRLWTASHSDTKDDELLHRERQSKRWSAIRGRVLGTFGSFRNLRTIELGSGRGDLSALFAEQGASVTLLDSSEKALDHARRRFDRLELFAEYQCGDMFTSVPQSSFDIAISSGVIEHFRDRERSAAIAAHHGALRPGGMAIISVPHSQCIPYRIWKAWLELRGSWPYGFELPYNRRELNRRARETGFQRTEIVGCGFRQALGDQLIPLLTGSAPRKSNRNSIFDGPMGLSLVLFGWTV